MTNEQASELKGLMKSRGINVVSVPPIAPTFIQRHYEAIACLFRSLPVSITERACCNCTVLSIEERLVAYFKQDNPKFKPEKFYKACGWH